MEKRREIGKDLFETMKTIDYQDLAICAAGIRSMSNAPSTDQDEKNAEAHAASDWAVRVWFDAIALSLFLQGKIKISGGDVDDIAIHCERERLPIDTPVEFVKLLIAASEE